MSRQSPEPSQTIPASLIDEHLRKIKDLSGQADDHEAEGKRRLTLAKEARLGIAALEAANKVLQGGLPAKPEVDRLPTTGIFPPSGLSIKNTPPDVGGFQPTREQGGD